MKTKEELIKLNVVEIKSEEHLAWKYYVLVRDILRAKKQEIIK